MLATQTPDQELNQMIEAEVWRKYEKNKHVVYIIQQLLVFSGMFGAGVFVTTGRVVESNSGPSVIYLLYHCWYFSSPSLIVLYGILCIDSYFSKGDFW